MIIRCIDVETTGLVPPEAAVCELGWCDVIGEATKWDARAPHSTLVNPGHPIPPAMSAVHHIIDSDIGSAPTIAAATEPLLKDDPIALCAHNAKFERAFLTMPAEWICTYKVALHLAPNAPAHNLQTLRYWLKLNVERTAAAPPHRAGPDAYVNAHLLVRMLAKLSVKEMIEISSRPALLPKFRFGKHKDLPLAEVPTDYLNWMASQKEMDEDVIHTAKHHLTLRSEAA